MLNKSTGKISSGVLTFNEANWGAATRAYTQSAREMDPYHLIEIMELANKFIKGKSSHRDCEPTIISMDLDDIRARLVDKRKCE